MPVGGERLWFVLEQAPVQIQVVPIIAVSRGVFQISLVLGNDTLSVLDQAESVLELAAQRQDGRHALEPWWQGQRRRCISAAAAQDARRTVHDSQHRVIHPVDNVPVV